MNKIYTSQGIGIASALGGPLAAGYLLSRNFKAFGFYQYSKNSIIFSIFTLLAYFVILILVPYNLSTNIPSLLFPLIFYGLSYRISDRYLRIHIDNHKESGGLTYSNWQAFGTGLIFAILTIIMGYATYRIIDLFAPIT